MTTHGSVLRSPASSLAVISTSVIGSLSVEVVGGLGWTGASRLRQHLAQLFGGGGDDGDEVGLAKPALRAMALEITARAAVEHRRMRGCDAGVACAQPKRDHPAPV